MTQAITPTRPRQTSKFAKIYAGAWALLAALALAYMAALAFQPKFLGDLADFKTEPSPTESQQAVARFATDITGVKQTVGQIEQDMGTLRTTVAGVASREKEIIERLAVVEERTKAPAVAEVALPKTAAQRQAEARAQKIAAAQAAAAAKAAPPAAHEAPAAVEQAAAAPQVTVLNPAATNPISTGSIQPPAYGLPAPPAPAAATTPGTFGPGSIKVSTANVPSGIELASGPSLDALRLNWSLLADRHAPALKNLEARYTNGGDGQPYQLVAGPIATPEEAQRVCAQLKAKQVSCRVTGFSGNAL